MGELLIVQIQTIVVKIQKSGPQDLSSNMECFHASVCLVQRICVKCKSCFCRTLAIVCLSRRALHVHVY